MAPTLRDELLDRARRAECEVAAGLGLAVEPPELIAFASNVILRLPPHDLVARVSGEAAEIRAGTDGRAREIAVTRFLAAAGAPVVAPSELIDPGPHAHDGLHISFWAHVRDEGSHNGVGDGAPKSAIAALKTLQRCRAALATCPEPLPYMQGYSETRRLFHELLRTDMLGTIDPADTVRRLAEIDAVLEGHGGASSPSNVPLHGDAHLKNMLVSGGQGLWIDWDDVCTGPVAWDHACLIVSLRDDESRAGDEAALMERLSGDIDPDLLAAMIDARNLQRELWDTAIKALNRSDIARQNLFVRGARFLRRQLQRMSNGR